MLVNMQRFSESRFNPQLIKSSSEIGGATISITVAGEAMLDSLTYKSRIAANLAIFELSLEGRAGIDLCEADEGRISDLTGTEAEVEHASSLQDKPVALFLLADSILASSYSCQTPMYITKNFPNFVTL